MFLRNSVEFVVINPFLETTLFNPWFISRCFRNDAADDYLLTELNALPDAVVESDVLWIDPERQLQQIVLDAVDKIVIDEPEYPDFNLHRQQYIQLEGALKHCLALKEITLKVGAQVRHLNS